MAYNFLLKLSFLLILLANLSLQSMAFLDEEDLERSTQVVYTRGQGKEDAPVQPTSPQERQTSYWKTKKDLINESLLPHVAATSMTIYKLNQRNIQFYNIDDQRHIKVPANYPLALLSQVDTTLFDETTIPRNLIACCHPKILTSIKGMAFILGGTAFPLITAALCNGILGRLFDYEVGGPASYTMLGISIAVAGPEGGIKLLKGARFILNTTRSTFQPISPQDDESTLYVPYTHRKSTSHKIADFLSFTGAFLYGLTPTVLWLIVEDPFPKIALSLALPLLVYSAESYWKVIKKATWQWFCQNKYTSLESKLIRLDFLRGLKKIESLIVEEQEETIKTNKELKDPEKQSLLGRKVKQDTRSKLQEESDEEEDTKLTQLLYECLRISSNDFGSKQGLDHVKDGEVVSPLSLLSTISLVIRELKEPPPRILEKIEKILTSSQKDPTTKIQEIRQALEIKAPIINHTTPSQPFRKLIAKHCASALSWLSVIPDAAMCVYGLSKGLPYLGVGETAAKVISFITAIPATLKLIPERFVHERTFETLSHPLTPEPKTFRKSRIGLTCKATIDAAFKALVYGTLTYWALAENNDFIRGFFVAVSVARFFSIFFTSNLDTYNETFTEIAIGRGENPSFERMKTRILDCIEKARTALGIDLSNETIEQIDATPCIKQDE